MNKKYFNPIGGDGYASHKRQRKSERGMHSLFYSDPKGDIENRRVKVLYANGFNDISGKL